MMHILGSRASAVSLDEEASPSDGPGLLRPLGLYLVLAAAVMLPLYWAKKGDPICGDWVGHLSGALEARAALAEGQFPPRVAPTHNRGQRYPLLQFYGQFPYTVTALLIQTGVEPWWACRLFLLAALALGGLFLCHCAFALTGRPR